MSQEEEDVITFSEDENEKKEVQKNSSPLYQQKKNIFTNQKLQKTDQLENQQQQQNEQQSKQQQNNKLENQTNEEQTQQNQNEQIKNNKPQMKLNLQNSEGKSKQKLRNAISMCDLDQKQEVTYNSKKQSMSIEEQDNEDENVDIELYSPQNLKKKQKLHTISTIHISNQQTKANAGKFYCSNFKPTKVMQFIQSSNNLEGREDNVEEEIQLEDQKNNKQGQQISSNQLQQQNTQEDNNQQQEEQKQNYKSTLGLIKLQKVEEGQPQNSILQNKENKPKKSVKFQEDTLDDKEEQNEQVEQSEKAPTIQIKKKKTLSAANITVLQEIKIENMHEFIFKPVPKGYIMQFHIIREESGLSYFAPKFHFYISLNSQYVMSARKEAISVSADYLISNNEKEFQKKSASYLGRVKADIVGSTFQIFDKGENPEKCKELEKIRCELGIISYSSDKGFGLKKIQVGIPKLQENDVPTEIRLMSNRQSFFNIFNSKIIKQQMQLFYSKKPVYNDAQKAYVLDFKGRATIASVKNFQIAKFEDDNNIILQMGKCDKQKFNVDVQYPFTPFQAFSICLSAFDYDFYK